MKSWYIFIFVMCLLAVPVFAGPITVLNPSFEFVGGENSPYIWINCKRDAWKFFDLLLKKVGVVTTPGPGFGKCGEGFLRISAINSYENVEQAMARIKDALGG